MIDRITEQRFRFRRGGGYRRQAGCGLTVLIGLGLVLLLTLIGSLANGVYIDLLWFDALGYRLVFEAILGSRIGLFALGLFASFVVLISNLWIARRLAGPQHPSYIPREELVDSGTRIGWVEFLATGLVSLAFGLILASDWSTVLFALNAVPFGISDPIFGQDVGFYAFSLPLIRLAHSTLMGLVVLTLIATAISYTLLLANEGTRGLLRTGVQAHLSAIGAIMLFLIAGGYWLDRFDLLSEGGRRVFGAGYTDVHVRIPALQALTVIVAVAGIALLANLWIRRIALAIASFVLWAVAAVALTGLWPTAVQRLIVEPSELVNELPYLEHNIRLTRRAFNLESVEDRPFSVQDDLSAQDLGRNPGTVENIRLWDYRPLRDTYNQVQSIRLYYEFRDIDVDRYLINGQYRQVMLAARELSQARLAGQAQTWVSRRLQFTHGYGIAMSAVNEVTGEGLPRFFVSGVPPTGELTITQPGIYFGELTDSDVIVGATDANLEFDYPQGDENVTTQYRGTGGVKLDSNLKRLLLAWRFGDGNLIFSSYIGPNSQLLMNRNVRDRVQRLAPYLRFDPDPYPVIADGKIVWIIDAYTHFDRFPYSETYRVANSTQAFNYLRNSVKATVDAYDGTVRFYVSDPTDPLIRAYSSAFPGTFRPISEMPATIRAHTRYPEFLFTVQAQMYRTYHMTEAQQFYNREDLWAIPRDLYAQSQGNLPMEPYYVIMRLPGETREEFVLILPYTPNNRDNMTAWLAARSDGDNYGKLLVIRFPTDRQVFGPAQIAARINQDPSISSALTLWNQQGSRVIRGNLLVIPLERSILYVEPIYLQAERSQLPELKRVVLATASRVVMEPTLGEAITRLFDIPTTPRPAATPSPGGPVTTSSDVASLIRSAQNHFDRAQERLRAGDFAGYGEEIKLLEADLRRLAELTPPR